MGSACGFTWPDQHMTSNVLISSYGVMAQTGAHGCFWGVGTCSSWKSAQAGESSKKVERLFQAQRWPDHFQLKLRSKGLGGPACC